MVDAELVRFCVSGLQDIALTSDHIIEQLLISAALTESDKRRTLVDSQDEFIHNS